MSDTVGFSRGCEEAVTPRSNFVLLASLEKMGAVPNDADAPSAVPVFPEDAS